MKTIDEKRWTAPLLLSFIFCFAIACDDSENGGVCEGMASHCASLYGQCESQEGCHTTNECSGFADGCYAMYSSYMCNNQEGCYYSYITNSCSGSATPCGSVMNCSNQEGCYWSSGCDGFPTQCDDFESKEYCENQQGCSWDKD